MIQDVTVELGQTLNYHFSLLVVTESVLDLKGHTGR